MGTEGAIQVGKAGRPSTLGLPVFLTVLTTFLRGRESINTLGQVKGKRVRAYTGF